METQSKMSSNSTKSKKSFVSIITRLFRRSKSAQSSKVTFDENTENTNKTEDSDDIENDEFTVQKDLNFNIIGQQIDEEMEMELEEITERRRPKSDIEIIMRDIHEDEWKIPKNKSVTMRDDSGTQTDESDEHINLVDKETEETIVINKNFRTNADIETYKTQSTASIETEELKDGILYEEYENRNDREYLQMLPLQIDTRYSGQEFSDEQLPQFCEQLHGLLEIIRNVQATKSFSTYPRELQMSLENDTKELELIYAEMRCIMTTIEQIKRQRELISSGRLEAVEQLTILENEEFEEIEKAINIHDTPIYKSWEKTKRSKTPESFEKLIKDIHSNQEALKNLEVLVRNRKAKINYMNKRFRSSSGPISDTNAVMPSIALTSDIGPQQNTLTN